MNDRRWESLDPADESFVDHALRAGRGELPDDARMRAMERRLGAALELEKDVPPSGWWRWSRVAPVVGLAVVALGVRAVSGPSDPPSSSPSPSPSVVAAPAIATNTPIAPAPAVETPASTVAVESLPTAKMAEPPLAKTPSASEAKARPQVVAATSAPSDELAILEAASRALEASPDKTLALTDEHMKRFRAPKFAQERERLAVVALVRLGRREEAKRRADAFEATFPESAHLTRVRELVRP